MPNTAARLSKASLTATSATLFTVPASTTTIVTEIIASNITTTDRKITVVFGGTIFLNTVTVPANGILSIGLKQVLLTTELITGFAEVAAAVNIFISGVNVT